MKPCNGICVVVLMSDALFFLLNARETTLKIHASRGTKALNQGLNLTRKNTITIVK